MVAHRTELTGMPVEDKQLFIQPQAGRSLDQENTTLEVGRTAIMKERNNLTVFREQWLFLESR